MLSFVLTLLSTQEWLATALAELKAAPPHEDPPVLSHQFEEQQRKLDREMMYLVNKIKSQPPPKPKPSTNATTNATTNTTTEKTPQVSWSIFIQLWTSSGCIILRHATLSIFFLLLLCTSVSIIFHFYVAP